jgi:hypothetical protein
MNKEAIGTLTGKYFHSVKADRETIEWQGKFLGLASPGLYRVQLFEWITGSESDQLLVPATDMRYWRIYDTQDQLIRAYEEYSRKREAKEASRRASTELMARADIVIQNGKVLKQRVSHPLNIVVDGLAVTAGAQ